MCGHVGLAGNLQFKDEALMKRLLLIDYIRGPDSTGLASIRDNGDIKIAKAAINPLDLFDTTKFKGTLAGDQSKILLGHNRAATKGAVNNVNAHPYQFGHIVGAHNGTLDVTCYRELEELLGEKYDTDSMAIFAAIEKLGIDETIPLLKGAWALVWYDSLEDTLNFIRNKERPMWHAWSKDLRTILWASEWEIIRAGIEVGEKKETELFEKQQEEGRIRYFNTAVDTLYTFKLADIKKAGKESRPDGRVKELKGKEPLKVVYTPANHGGNFPRKNVGNSASTGASHSNVLEYPKKGNKNRTVIQLMAPGNMPYGDQITPQRFAELARNGCSWCEEEMEFGDEGVTIFNEQDVILCAHCMAGGTLGTRVHLKNIEKVA